MIHGHISSLNLTNTIAKTGKNDGILGYKAMNQWLHSKMCKINTIICNLTKIPISYLGIEMSTCSSLSIDISHLNLVMVTGDNVGKNGHSTLLYNQPSLHNHHYFNVH